jgi:hypothetical protein
MGFNAVDGTKIIALEHRPEDKKFQSRLGDSLDRAKKMVNEGKGSERSDFTNVNQGDTSIINGTAKIYLSWFSPKGAAVMPRNASAVKPGIAVLYVVGKQNPIYEGVTVCCLLFPYNTLYFLYFPDQGRSERSSSP